MLIIEGDPVLILVIIIISMLAMREHCLDKSLQFRNQIRQRQIQQIKASIRQLYNAPTSKSKIQCELCIGSRELWPMGIVCCMHERQVASALCCSFLGEPELMMGVWRRMSAFQEVKIQLLFLVQVFGHCDLHKDKVRILLGHPLVPMILSGQLEYWLYEISREEQESQIEIAMIHRLSSEWIKLWIIFFGWTQPELAFKWIRNMLQGDDKHIVQGLSLALAMVQDCQTATVEMYGKMWEILSQYLSQHQQHKNKPQQLQLQTQLTLSYLQSSPPQLPTSSILPHISKLVHQLNQLSSQNICPFSHSYLVQDRNIYAHVQYRYEKILQNIGERDWRNMEEEI